MAADNDDTKDDNTDNLDPTAKQPKTFWHRDVDVNVRKLLEGLTLAYLKWKAKKVKSLGDDLVKIGGTLTLKAQSPEELAWNLTFTALTEALGKNTQPHVSALRLSEDEDPAAFAEALKLPSLEGQIVFDAAFFADPGEAPFFQVVGDGYRQWLEGAGMPPAEAALVARRLGTAFTFALHREWIANSTRYASLVDWLGSPFTRAVDSQRRWLAYYADLEDEYDKSVFGESYGLRDLYIPLNAYHETCDGESQPITAGRTRRARPDENPDESAVIIRHVVPLEEHLDNWLEEPSPEYPLLLISGGPGSGKSSFLRHYAASLGRRDKTVLFIPLQHLEYDRQITTALENFVRRHPILQDAVDLSGRSELILLFDGLDELSMAGHHGLEAARDFVGALKDFLNRVNANGCMIRVILSGRTLAIQADRSYGRDEGQVLHLLPYFTLEKEREPAAGEKKFKFDDPQALLVHDYRCDWWARLHQLMGSEAGSAPDHLLQAPFDVLTNQPLLNVLIAISMSGPAEEALQIDENTNLNHVYAHLLQRVWERNDKRGINRIDEADFNAAMEGVAVATWHGNGRTANAEAIREHVGDALLQEFSEEAESSVYSLLVGFFFQGGGRDATGQSVYEFTHKSFGEYLTAQSLFALLHDLLAEHERWAQNPRRGMDVQACLVAWTEHCGPTAMDRDLWAFVRREAALQCTAGALDGGKARALVLAMMNHGLASGMPMKETAFRDATFQIQTEYARNSELALLLTLSALRDGDNTAESTIAIAWPDECAAGNWLNRLRMQRIMYYEGSLALGALGSVSFEGQVLCAQDLVGANLVDANLVGAHLVGAHLVGADLLGADLLGADLRGAHLRGAHLRGANLRGAHLEGAHLEGADLLGADLLGADLLGAHLVRANLVRANLVRANLANIHNWKDIEEIGGCNITGVQNAPKGFVEWALARGAVQD